MVFWMLMIPKLHTFRQIFNKRKKSHRLKLEEYGAWGKTMIQFWSKTGLQKGLSDKEHCHVQHPSVHSCWPNTSHSLMQSFKSPTVKRLIHSLPFRHKFCVNNPFTVKKINEHGLDYCWLLLLGGTVSLLSHYKLNHSPCEWGDPDTRSLIVPLLNCEFFLA